MHSKLMKNDDVSDAEKFRLKQAQFLVDYWRAAEPYAPNTMAAFNDWVRKLPPASRTQFTEAAKEPFRQRLVVAGLRPSR